MKKNANKTLIILGIIVVIMIFVVLVVFTDENNQDDVKGETQREIQNRYDNYENEDLSLGMYASSESELFDMSSISLDSDTKEKKVRIAFNIQAKVDIVQSQTVVLSFYDKEKKLIENISFSLNPKNSGENETIELESNNLDLMISQEVEFVIQ